jgi:hypothetical protein
MSKLHLSENEKMKIYDQFKIFFQFYCQKREQVYINNKEIESHNMDSPSSCETAKSEKGLSSVKTFIENLNTVLQAWDNIPEPYPYKHFRSVRFSYDTPVDFDSHDMLKHMYKDESAHETLKRESLLHATKKLDIIYQQIMDDVPFLKSQRYSLIIYREVNKMPSQVFIHFDEKPLSCVKNDDELEWLLNTLSNFSSAQTAVTALVHNEYHLLAVNAEEAIIACELFRCKNKENFKFPTIYETTFVKLAPQKSIMRSLMPGIKFMYE